MSSILHIIYNYKNLPDAKHYRNKEEEKYMKLPSALIFELVGPKFQEILQGTSCKKHAITQCVSQEQYEKLVVVECNTIIDPKINIE